MVQGNLCPGLKTMPCLILSLVYSLALTEATEEKLYKRVTDHSHYF